METYTVEFWEEEIEVDVPKGTNRGDAFVLFCGAAARHLDFKKRYFAVSKCDAEYAGCGGMFQTYSMPTDRSGYVYAEVWFTASRK